MTQKQPPKKPLGSGIKFVLPTPDPDQVGNAEPPPQAAPPAAAPQVAPLQPARGMTGVGAISRMIEGARSGTGPASGPPLLDPALIDLTEWADRHEDSFRTAEFEELKESIRLSGGNLQPIKVRQATGRGEGGQVRYQLVFGSRRLRACRELGLKVRATIETVDGDRGLYLQMLGENRGRAGLSPWEQGMSYHRAINKGLFRTQAELVASSGLDQSNVSKAMRIAELPQELTSLFDSPTHITFKSGIALMDALKERGDEVMRRAAAVRGGESQSAQEIVRQLLATEPRRVPKASRRALALPGSKAGRVEVAADGALRLQLPKGAIKAEKLQAFLERLEKLIGEL